MRSFTAIAFVLLLSAPALGQTPGAGDPPAGDPKIEAAKQHHDKGVEFFEAGDYESALTEFKATYDLSKRQDVLFNMAVATDKLGRYSESAGYLERYLTLEPGAKDAKELLAKVRTKMAASASAALPPTRRTASKPPAGASVLVALGASLLIADIGTAAAGYSLSSRVESQPLDLWTYLDSEAQGQRLNQASAALLAIGLSASLAGVTWHLVAYGRQHRTP
jgi:tetratricopeptide (TPR) repeat protein